MKHTQLIWVAIAFFWFASCNNPAPSDNGMPHTDTTATKMDKTDRNKKVAMEAMDGMNSHDTGKVFKTMAANFTDYMDGTMPPQKGDSAKQTLQMLMTAFPDMKGENMIVCADGDNVMIAADWTMTFKNDMMGMKATGKTAKYKDVDIFTFDDNGKIISHRSIYPGSTMMALVGVDMAKIQAMDKDKMSGDKKK
ncbi:MAG TPA: ester cyclase [Flavipsychrobacter sp.]|nr:ester cyclase [Flavipsychrobacter sp.]